MSRLSETALRLTCTAAQSKRFVDLMESVQPEGTFDWEAWQARKRAAYEADQRALASGEKSAQQLMDENGAVSKEVASAPLPWEDLLW
jgi:hypothetical protein